MDLEVKLFNPRRIVCEAVRITEENYQQVRLWVSGDSTIVPNIGKGTTGKWVVRRGDHKFDLMTEGQLWGLYEPLLH